MSEQFNEHKVRWETAFSLPDFENTFQATGGYVISFP